MTKETLYCSFCGESLHDVRKLIAGGISVFICDACVALCVEVLAEEDKSKTRKKGKKAKKAPVVIKTAHAETAKEIAKSIARIRKALA